MACEIYSQWHWLDVDLDNAAAANTAKKANKNQQQMHEKLSGGRIQANAIMATWTRAAAFNVKSSNMFCILHIYRLFQ